MDRRLLTLIVGAVVVVGLAVGAGALIGGQAGHGSSTAGGAAGTSTTTAASTTTSSTTTTTTRPSTPSDARRLTPFRTINGAISPKSVVASGKGFVSAQNMMYQHSVTVYDAGGNLAKTIPDSIDLTAYGVTGHPGISKGAPVEAAYSKDGRFAYVSNYSMYGAGFGPEGSDDCQAGDGTSESFLYRINMSTLAVDGVAAVGAVPKYVAVTPDQRYVLVSDWCSFALSVVDRASMREVKRIPLGPYPRGIAVSSDSSKAYVAVMGGRDVAVIDLRSLTNGWIRNVGGGPRHLVLDPTDRYLYATLNKDGQVVKIDTTSGTVVGRVATGNQPRSMDISPDGTALYVVNYESNNVAKVRTADLAVMQTIPTGVHPIGITYEPTRDRVWVAIYTGAIVVLADA